MCQSHARNRWNGETLMVCSRSHPAFAEESNLRHQTALLLGWFRLHQQGQNIKLHFLCNLFSPAFLFHTDDFLTWNTSLKERMSKVFLPVLFPGSLSNKRRRFFRRATFFGNRSKRINLLDWVGIRFVTGELCGLFSTAFACVLFQITWQTSSY